MDGIFSFRCDTSKECRLFFVKSKYVELMLWSHEVFFFFNENLNVAKTFKRNMYLLGLFYHYILMMN